MNKKVEIDIRIVSEEFREDILTFGKPFTSINKYQRKALADKIAGNEIKEEYDESFKYLIWMPEKETRKINSIEDGVEDFVRSVKEAFLNSSGLKDYDFIVSLWYDFSTYDHDTMEIILEIGAEFQNQKAEEEYEDIIPRFEYILSNEGFGNLSTSIIDNETKGNLNNENKEDTKKKNFKDYLYENGKINRNDNLDDMDDMILDESIYDIFTGEKKNNRDNNVISPLSDITSNFKDKKKKKKKSTRLQNTSRSIKASKHPKRDFNRHGVIISKKDAIERDRKTIKGFLKDFIPGDEKWKKEFRNDLLDRWMDMYVITSKKLKKLEKKANEKKNNKNQLSPRTKRMISEVGRRLTSPVSAWDDVNK